MKATFEFVKLLCGFVSKKFVRSCFVLCVLMLLINIQFLFSQEFFSENFNHENGLPSNMVYDLFFDSKGYLWIATEEGIVRYNGIQFSSFKNNLNISLAGSQIHEDETGRIWYQNFDGDYLFVENDRLYKAPFPKSTTYKVFTIQNNSLFRIFQNQLQVIDLKTFKLKTIDTLDDLYFCYVFANKLVYGSREVRIFDLITGQKNSIFTSDENYRSLGSFFGGDKLFLTDKSQVNSFLIQIFPQDGKIKQNHIIHPAPLLNFKEYGGYYWSLSAKGLYRQKTFLKSNLEPIVQGIATSCITFDKQGNLWVGTLGKGIILINDFSSKELKFPQDNFENIIAHKDELYAGTNQGKVLELDDGLKIKRSYSTTSNHSAKILLVHKDMIAYQTNEFKLYDKNTGKKQVFYFAAKDVALLNDKTLAVAFTGGMVLLEKMKSQWVIKDYLEKDVRAKSCVYDAKNKLLYYSTSNGLYVTDFSNKRAIEWKGDKIFLKKMVICRESLYGITTGGNFFFIENGKANVFEPNDKLTDIKSHEDKLFASTKHKIVEWNRGNFKTILALSTRNSIQTFEVLREMFVINTGRKLVLTRPNGNLLGKVKFHLLKTNFTNILKSDSTYVLPNKTEKVSITYNVLDFSGYDAHQYYYNLNGSSFSLNPRERTITLPNLSDGEYVMQLFAKDKETNKIIAKSDALRFKITPPFWKKTSFFIASSLFVLLFFVLIYRMQIRKISRKNAKKLEYLMQENKISELKLQLIKSQMNPHFFFNAINNIQSYILSNNPKIASEYLSKLAKLTRKILAQSDLSAIPLVEEIETLKLYLELQRMRFPDLNYEIQPQDIPNQKIKIPAMLLQPYVENAVLHGLRHSEKEKRIKISFSVNSQILTCLIEDNGIGREESAKINASHPTHSNHQSFAHQAQIERIKLLHLQSYVIDEKIEDLHDSFGKPIGTRIMLNIHLPLKENHESNYNRR